MWRINFTNESVAERLTLYTALNSLMVSGKYNKLFHGSGQEAALTYFLYESNYEIVNKFLQVIESYDIKELFDELYVHNFEVYKNFWMERTPWKHLKHINDDAGPLARHTYESHISDLYFEVMAQSLKELPSEKQMLASGISVEDELTIAILIFNTDSDTKLSILDWREQYEDERDYDHHEGRTDSLEIESFGEKSYSSLADQLEYTIYQPEMH